MEQMKVRNHFRHTKEKFCIALQKKNSIITLFLYLGAFDVIVQVVPECVNQIDGVVPGSSTGVAGEQHCKGEGNRK